MAYLGNTPADRFASYKYQDFTGGSGTSFTLDHPSTTNGLRVVINNVVQEPTEAYSVSGTALTLTGSVSTTDDFYVVFLEQAILTATHPATQALSATDGTFTGNVSITGTTSSTGAITATAGIIVPSGQGIDFSATSDGSGTTQSELLDDYEEGLFDPTLVSVTGAFGSITYDAFTKGAYTKIGRVVYVTLTVRTDSITIGTAGTGVKISGFPFAVAANDPSTSRNMLGAINITDQTSFSSDSPNRGQFSASSSEIILQKQSAISSNIALLTPSDLGTGANANRMSIAGFYFTD